MKQDEKTKFETSVNMYNLSCFVVIKNGVDKFSHMIRWAFIIFVDINPVKSCAQVDNLLNITQHTVGHINSFMYEVSYGHIGLQ